MTSFSHLALLAALALPSLLSGCTTDSSVGGNPDDPNETECTPGQTKKADDACNTCSCQPNGFFACTELACAKPGECKTDADCGPNPQSQSGQCPSCPDGSPACPTSICQVGQCVTQQAKCPSPVMCQPGETKVAPDGCNTCTCQKDGSFACTEIACVPNCKSDLDCPQPGAPCLSAVCQTGTCTVIGDPSCGPCKEPSPPCAAPPLGCDYQGGGCVNGQWTCGTLVCESQCASVNDCPPPPPDGCSQVACEKGMCVISQNPSCPNGCDQQDAVGTGPCDAFFGHAWNGQQCVGISGCGCKGSDCDKLVELAVCQKVHANCPTLDACKTDQDCGKVCNLCSDGSQVCAQSSCTNGQCTTPPDSPLCAGIVPGGKCDQPGSTAPASDGCNKCTCEKSFTWSCTKINCPPQCQSNLDCPPPGAPCLSAICDLGKCTLAEELNCGGSCTTTSDCAQPMPPECVKCMGINNCSQSYCDTQPESGVCRVLAPSCGDSCQAQDIQMVGPCDAFLGYSWDGKSCQGNSGCSCQGKDCSQLYQDKITCKTIHQSCVGAP